jgi:hypothetical protein
VHEREQDAKVGQEGKYPTNGRHQWRIRPEPRRQQDTTAQPRPVLQPPKKVPPSQSQRSNSARLRRRPPFSNPQITQLSKVLIFQAVSRRRTRVPTSSPPTRPTIPPIIHGLPPRNQRRSLVPRPETQPEFLVPDRNRFLCPG